ncbi:MAG: hypothetical protein K2K07_07860, partial [Lachnospiraceae bacterium]|nr:hypothetical protein [Lachnospiraceae bacterium]
MQKDTVKKKAALFVLIFLMIYTNFITLQASCHVARRLLMTKPAYILCNLLLLAAVYCIIASFSPSPWIAGVIFSTACTAWALVNNYVYALHGQVFTLAEISNAKTALHVMDVTLLLKKTPLIFGAAVLIIYGSGIVLCYLQKRVVAGEEKISGKKAVVCRIALLLAGGCMLWVMSFPAKNLQSVILKDWTSRNTCIEEGYPLYVYANVFLNDIKITQPDGYDEELLTDYEDYKDDTEGVCEQLPDIILILNESFYDLSILGDLQTDVPYMENYYSMD